MGSQKIEVITGFIVVLFAALFLSYGLGQTNMQLSEGYYPLKASFSDVTGISSGADVKMSGVKVGTVSSANINPESFQADVTLLLRNDVKIPYDSSVKIASDGLLGGAHITIDVGSEEETLNSGDSFSYTQSAVSLMDLLSRAVFSAGASADE